MKNFKLIPHHHLATVKVAKAYATKAKSGSVYLQIEAKIQDAEFKNRSVFGRFMLANTSVTAMQISADMFQRLIESSEVEPGEPPKKPENIGEKNEVPWLIGAETNVCIELIENPGFKAFNQICDYFPKNMGKKRYKSRVLDA